MSDIHGGRWTHKIDNAIFDEIKKDEVAITQSQGLYDFMKNNIANNAESIIQRLNFKGYITVHKVVPLFIDNMTRYTNLENVLRFYCDCEKRVMMYVPGLWSATWLNAPTNQHVISANIPFDKTILYNDIKNELNITYDYDLNTLTLLQYYVSEHYDYLLKKYQND